MVSQCTKFEVSRFTRCEAVNGGAKYRQEAQLSPRDRAMRRVN